MAEYIFRFNQNCCPAGRINYVTNFTFTPNGGSGAVINSVENTVYGGNVTDFVIIDGENVVDEFGEINGNLEVDIQCLDWCTLSFLNNLFPVQINGFGLGIQSLTTVTAVAGGNCLIGTGNRFVQLRADAIPLNKKIMVQLMGGMGNIRFANTDDPKVIKIDKFIAFESANYRPEMKAMGPTQASRGDYIVDRDLGKGAHRFELEAVGIGTTKVTFTDEAGCFYIMAFDVKPNLCDPQAPALPPVPNDADSKNIAQGEDMLGNDPDFQIEHGHFCDCDPFNGNAQVGNAPMSYPFGAEEGFTKLKDLYDGDEFIHGTRHVDLDAVAGMGPAQLPIKPAKIIKMKVGEEFEMEMPNIGGLTEVNWGVETLQWKPAGAAPGVQGEGWDDTVYGPSFSNLEGPEGNIVNATMEAGARRGPKNKLKISCLAPTNNLSTTLHLKIEENNISSLGGPIPLNPRNVVVSQEPADAIASYTSYSTGRTTYLKAEAQGNSISMTQPDFFLGVQCFCPELDIDIVGNQGLYEDGDTIEFEIDGPGQQLLPKTKRLYITKESVIGEGSLDWANPLQKPDNDNLNPEDQKFRFAQVDQDGVIVWSTIQLIYTNSSNDATPVNRHLPAENAFFTQFFDQQDFFKDVDGNTKTYLKHTPNDVAFQCFGQQGVTVQTRGTWCINNQNVIAKFPKKIPAIKSNLDGKAKALQAEQKTLLLPDIILEANPVKKLEKRSTLRIESDPGGGGIRG